MTRGLRFPGRRGPDTGRPDVEMPSPALVRFTEVRRHLDFVAALREVACETRRLREALAGARK